MKKRILLVLILVYFILSNDILAFSSEIPSIGSEETIDETDYSMYAFGDKTYDGMSVNASIDGWLPEKTEMKVSINKMDSNKVDNVKYVFNEDDKIINITSIKVGFFNNEEVIRLKDGTKVHFEVLMNIEETTGNHKILRLINESNYEVITANETIVKGSFDDLQDNSLKKQFSFDISLNNDYSDSFIFFIIEYEAFTEQNQGEIIPEQIVDEPTPEQVEVEPSNEKAEAEVMPEQEETEITPGKEETETVPEQNNVENEPEQEVVETASEQSKVETATITEQDKSETKPEKKDVEENTPKPDKAETKPEKSSEEPQNKQDKTEQKQERNETIDIEGKVIWDDNNNQDGIRPSSVCLSLRDSDGKKYPITVEEDEENKNIWKYSVKALPKYSSEKELKYSIKKEKVKGYEINIDGYDVEYKHEPETVLIEGQIMWSDSINKDKIRPEEVTVELYGDGDYKASNLVSKETKWKYSFGEFPKYDAGREIEYSIKEETIDGYEFKLYGFNITNIHEAGNEDASIETTKSESSNKTSKTWKKSNVVCFIVIMILFIAIMIFIIIKSDFFK